MHINFMAEMYREQIEDGHYFLHEHPRWATSWVLPEIEKLMRVPSVGFTHGDQCQYGAELYEEPRKVSRSRNLQGSSATPRWSWRSYRSSVAVQEDTAQDPRGREGLKST